MNIAIASDHAGFDYNERIKQHLAAVGHMVEDFGTFSTDPVDYPDFIRPAAQAVATGKCERGIVVGGSGNGEAIVANRLSGIRCAVCWNEKSARLARRHNDANMILLGQRMMDFDVAQTIVDTWLSTDFENGRHRRRIEKIDQGCISHEDMKGIALTDEPSTAARWLEEANRGQCHLNGGLAEMLGLHCQAETESTEVTDDHDS